MRKSAVLAVIAGVLAVVLAACGGGSDSGGGGESGGESGESGPVKIGMIEALSGSAADFGTGGLHGAQLAIKQVNGEGGVESLGGAKLELETYDLQSNPALAGGLAQQAVDDGDAAVIGASISDAVIAGTNVTQREGIPWINTGSLADMITDRGYDTVFATQSSASQVAAANVDAFQEIGEELGKPVKTVAVTYIGLAYGEELFEDFQEASEGQLDIVASTSYPPETTDFGAIAASIASESPDVIYNIGFSPDGIAFGTALAQAGANPAIAFFQGVPPATAVSEAKKQSEGWMMRLDLREEYEYESKGFEDFFKSYEEEFGVEPENTSDNAYTAVMAIRSALEETGSDDPAELTEALHEVELTGEEGNPYPKDTFTFDESGLVEEPTIGIVQIQGGKVQTVWPEELATAEAKPYGGS